MDFYTVTLCVPVTDKPFDYQPLFDFLTDQLCDFVPKVVIWEINGCREISVDVAGTEEELLSWEDEIRTAIEDGNDSKANSWDFSVYLTEEAVA